MRVCVQEERGQLWIKFNTAPRETLGMLSRMGEVAHPLPVRLHTGDVLLFNQSTAPARLTKLFTWSKWSHAAMIVQVRKTGTLQVLEATGAGVQLYDWASVWYRYHRTTHVAVCRLMVPNALTDDDHDRLYDFIDTVRGRPYEKSLIGLVSKVTRSGARSRSSSMGDSADNITSINSSANNSTQNNNSNGSGRDMTEVFCSELVAGTFRALGLLKAGAALELLPKHFDSSESGRMQLERGAVLFPPRVFIKNELAEY